MTTALPGVVVTDGHDRAALAVVRSLGRAGYRVAVCAQRPRSLAGASRYAAAAIATPDALADPAGFAAAVQQFARAQGATIILPIADASLLALLGDERSAEFVIPFPPLERWRAVADKARVLVAATEQGIAVPASVELSSTRAAADQLGALPFPIVLKPHRSVIDESGVRAKVGVRHAATADAARHALADLPPGAFPVMAQERIWGPGVGVFVLLWEGRLLAACAHQRLREKPPAGGVSVYRESVALDPDLLRRSVALLRSFDWNGVAMLEFKRRASDGTPFLMEINGRFWGSLQLAVDAGVDFPRLLVEAATGRVPQPVLTYQTGVRSRWWWGDVDHLLLRLLRSRAALDLPPDAPGGGRVRALWEFLRMRRGDRNEVLRRDDPRPFIRETLDWLQGRSA
jgi:predicted ATP-grasp superfamily ATP-dependent carboligase